jgi:hypothetical protein
MPRVAVLSILAALVVAPTASSTDPEALFYLVKIGMSRPQVEAYFGPFEGSTLTYEPGGRMIIINGDGKVDADISFSYPDEPKSPEGRRLPSEATRRDVLSLLGPPEKECVRYDMPDRNGRYDFCFADDKLVSKTFAEYLLPPPIVHHMTCAHSHSVFFDRGSSALTAQARQVLDNFSKKCAGMQGRIAYIWGHDDSEGSSEANMETSRIRAEVVRDHLISLGFAPEQLQVEAYGNTKRLTPERLDPQNRRVEVIMP